MASNLKLAERIRSELEVGVDFALTLPAK